MKKNLTIFCDDDSFEVENQKRINTTKNQTRSRSPMYMTNKSFKFNHQTLCQTPQSTQTNKQPYQFKSPKYVGVIQRTLLQRLDYYDQKNKNKMQNSQISTKIKEQQNWIRQIRQKPQINEISKNLFQKVKKQRKLSPNILERFQTYECQRVSRAAKYQLLKTYGVIVKNNTPTCRHITKQTSRSPLKQQKSRSPLKQKSFNRQQGFNRQMSKSFQTLQNRKIHKDSSNIGKLVKNSQIHQQNNSSQISFKITPVKMNKNQNKTYESQCQNKKHQKTQKTNHKTSNKLKNQQNMYESTQQDKEKGFTTNFQQMVNKNQKSPFTQKKSYYNTKKWKVIN